MYPENIPIDVTGYGPTGTGYRPTQGAIRRQQENKYRTNRNVEMMHHDDPTVNAAVEAFARPFYSANEDPAAVRRAMYSDPRAQGVRDLAMLGRRTGFLGAGNPVNYSHNMTRGIAGGGFTTDIIGKDAGGRSVLGLDQRVQGNGLLSERVTQRFQKEMLNEMYGKDADTDPRKMSGFDMEEASGVAATIMRRGGVGKAATWIKGADAQTRVDAAATAATPEMREKLAGIKVGSNEELTKLAEATSDPKLRAELTGLAKATDAIVPNDGAAKKVAGVVREVTKGMAALSDMYGELGAPALHQMLESISGEQIVNKQQAKHAAGMVNDMRNSAHALGMDERAYTDYAKQTQQSFHQQFMQSGGFDERSGTSATKASATISADIRKAAASAAVASQQATKDGEALGYDMTGTTRSAVEIGIDMQNQQAQSQERSRGEAMVRGGIDHILDPTINAKAKALLDAKDSTTNSAERDIIENQLRALAGATWGGDSQSIETAEASAAGQEFKTRGYANSKQIASSRAEDLDAINTSVVDDVGVYKLGMERPDAEKFSQQMLQRLGKKGMVDLATIASGADQIGDQKVTAEDRNLKIKNMLADSDMSEDEANAFRAKLIDEKTGRFKDPSVGESLSRGIGLVSRGGQSSYERQAAAEARLAEQGFDNNRDKIGANADDKVTTAGIVNALIKKSIGGADDDETIGLTLQAMKDEKRAPLMVDAKDENGKVIMENGKAKQVNALDGVDAGINMSENISVEAAERLTVVNGGKDLGLLKKFGFKDNADMAEQTKNPELREKVLASLKENTDISLTGNLRHTTATSQSTLRAARDAKDGPAAEMRKRAGAAALSGGVDVSYAVDKAPDGFGATLKGFLQGKGIRHSPKGYMENNRKFVDAAKNINSADDADLKNIKEFNKDDAFGKSMKEQLAALKEAQAGDVDTINSRDPKTGETAKDKTAEAISQLESAIARLYGTDTKSGGGGPVAYMRVTDLHIDNVVDLKKS